jgi:hypothetical protein
VWDLNANAAVKNWDSLKAVRWLKLNFPNSFYAQYVFYEDLLSSVSGPDSAYQ